MTSSRHELPDFERGRIVGAADFGGNPSEIARRYEIPRTTVRSVIQNPTQRNNSRTGRPRSLDERDERRLLREVQKNPKISYQDLIDTL